MIARHPLISAAATVWGPARRGLQHVRPGLHHRSSHHINTSPHSPPLHTFAAPKNFTLISFVSKKRILMDLVLSLKLFKWQCLCEMRCQLLSRNLVSTAPGWRWSGGNWAPDRRHAWEAARWWAEQSAALQGSHSATTWKCMLSVLWAMGVWNLTTEQQIHFWSFQEIMFSSSQLLHYMHYSQLYWDC